MKDKISVIIPCYNVDKYIEKCLESVLSQTYDDLEVIAVNDGSTDGTADLILKYKSDFRLRFIDKKNAGVTAARNTGIEAASGDYIAFVDSDDWLESDMYERLHTALTENDADVAVCDYNLVYDDRTVRCYSGMKNEVIEVKPKDYYFKYCSCPKPNNYVWTRLYKTEIIKKTGVRFENFKLGDDTLFNFKLLPHLSRVVNISGAGYNYLQRENSNVYTVATKDNLAKVYADTFEELVSYYEANGFEDFLKAMPVHAYTRLRSVIFYSRLANMSESEIVKSIITGFQDRKIADYLREISGVDDYVKINGFSNEASRQIKQIMHNAADNPNELAGVVF